MRGMGGAEGGALCLRGRLDRPIQFPFFHRGWWPMAFDYAKISGPKRRAKVLLRTRNLKMARNAHAYVRGSTLKFYGWLGDGGRKLPPGASGWVWGECPFGNVGALARARRHARRPISCPPRRGHGSLLH